MTLLSIGFMTLQEFRASLSAASPPDGLSHALAALWWDAHGDWEHAHESAQSGDNRESAWAHAYLHRKEGDDWNAAYWYRQAGKPIFKGTHEEEADAMLKELLK
jgi:hypothetical protein